MIHEILPPVGPLQCNCSIIGDETTRDAMVIDPGDDIADVLGILQKHSLKVSQIVTTHAHIDHVGGAMKLREVTGAPILLNQNDYALLKMLDVQAAWLGMRSPDEVQIDRSVGDADKDRGRSAGRAGDPHARTHRRQHLPIFSGRTEAYSGRHVVCRKHRTHRPPRRLVRQDHPVAAR